MVLCVQCVSLILIETFLVTKATKEQSTQRRINGVHNLVFLVVLHVLCVPHLGICIARNARVRKVRKVVFSIFFALFAPALPTGQAGCRQAGFIAIIAIIAIPNYNSNIFKFSNQPAGWQVFKLAHCIVVRCAPHSRVL